MLDRLYASHELDNLEGDFELDEGRLVPVTRPQRKHAKICARLTFELVGHCRRTGQGEVLCNDPGFLLAQTPDTLRGPDIAVLRSERAEQLPENGWPEGAPDLVVEVVSPTDRAGTLQRKVGQYLDAGAELVWVVYPERRKIAVYEATGLVLLLGEDDDLPGEPVLPGFRCRVGEIFG